MDFLSHLWLWPLLHEDNTPISTFWRDHVYSLSKLSLCDCNDFILFCFLNFLLRFLSLGWCLLWRLSLGGRWKARWCFNAFMTGIQENHGTVDVFKNIIEDNTLTVLLENVSSFEFSDFSFVNALVAIGFSSLNYLNSLISKGFNIRLSILN